MLVFFFQNQKPNPSTSSSTPKELSDLGDEFNSSPQQTEKPTSQPPSLDELL